MKRQLMIWLMVFLFTPRTGTTPHRNGEAGKLLRMGLDVRNRPATWVTGIGLDDLLNNDFVYDAFGNITEIGSDDYGYDNLNRLTTSTVNGTSFGYSYDSVGNIETVTKGGSPAGSFGYNQNRITGLTYDTDGNLTDDGVNTYVYDALGQTASVTNSGGTVSYRYDALGKRISANDGSVDTVYAYLGEQLIAEYTGVDYSNSVFMEGQLLARVTDNGVDTTTVEYAHLNHLGSPVAFTDGTAAVVWPEQVGGTPYEIHNYEPFGADFDDIGTPALSPQDVRYTGKLLDAGTGKHYFNARYLNEVTDVASPELPPRFLSPDIVIGTPESPQSWNRYASCLNNPVNLVDLNGMWSTKAFLKGIANTVAEPVRAIADVGQVGMIAINNTFSDTEIALEDVHFSSTSAKSTQQKILSGQGRIGAVGSGLKDTGLTVSTGSLYNIYRNVKAFNEGEISIDELDQNLSSIAGGQVTAIASAAGARAVGYEVNFTRYPNAKGVGLNLVKHSKNGAKPLRVLGLDWHRFKSPKKVGPLVNRPHIDSNPLGLKHWPWK